MAGGSNPGTTSRDPAGDLLVRSRTDPEAFGELYDRALPTILGWFVRRTGSPTVGMDLAAETFAAALASVHRFDPERGHGMSWLFGIASHQYHHWLRRGEVDRRYRRRTSITTPAVTPDDVDRVIDLVDAQDLVPKLRAALDGLSDGVRAAVELRVGYDLPYAEVAARLGVTEGNARVRVQRGLRHLATTMVIR